VTSRAQELAPNKIYKMRVEASTALVPIYLCTVTQTKIFLAGARLPTGQKFSRPTTRTLCGSQRYSQRTLQQRATSISIRRAATTLAMGALKTYTAHSFPNTRSLITFIHRLRALKISTTSKTKQSAAPLRKYSGAITTSQTGACQCLILRQGTWVQICKANVISTQVLGSRALMASMPTARLRPTIRNKGGQAVKGHLMS
jgi:hypothetical protein